MSAWRRRGERCEWVGVKVGCACAKEAHLLGVTRRFGLGGGGLENVDDAGGWVEVRGDRVIGERTLEVGW
jgi:hypothetical protein